VRPNWKLLAISSNNVLGGDVTLLDEATKAVREEVDRFMGTRIAQLVKSLDL